MSQKTPEQISFNMRRVRCKDTKIEIQLRNELWKRGIRYRKNVSHILGKPDIAFIGKKVAVFCDSEFWHGFDWENKKCEIKTHESFWYTKIERNMQRDFEVTTQLQSEGWLVLRFWGNEIKHHCTECADKIEQALEGR